MIIEHSRKGRQTTLPGSMTPTSSKGIMGSVSLLAYLITFILLPAVSVCSCRPEEPEEEIPQSGEDAPEKGIRTMIDINSGCSWAGVKHSDIFIYSTQGTCPLEKHFQTETFPCETVLPEGEKTVVILANSKAQFNVAALSRMDSMESLCYNFQDDAAQEPLMTGSAAVAAGEEVRIELRPLMCRIVLQDVSNNLPGYALLENPRIFLTGMSPSCQVLRTEEFRPTQSMDASSETVLGCDVGFFTKRYGVSLYCYPNDTPDDILGAERTIFNFECEIGESTVLFSSTLPPTKRNSTVEVSLTVESESEYRYDFYLKD